MLPERLCSGVSELPTGLPTGVRPVGAAKGERVPTADVGAPIKRAGVATGCGGADAVGVADWAPTPTGTLVAITAPTVPAMLSSASRRVMSPSDPASGCLSSTGASRFATSSHLTRVGVGLLRAYGACRVAVPEAGIRVSRQRSSNSFRWELPEGSTSYSVVKIEP